MNGQTPKVEAPNPKKAAGRARRILLVITACAVVAVLAAVVWPGEKEPAYRGRTLDDWIQRGRDSLPDSPEWREARRAVFDLGTNGLPYLLRAIALEQPAWKEEAASYVEKWPLPFGIQPLALRHLLENAYRAHRAELGLRMLGKTAAPAVPELTRLMYSTNVEAATRAMNVLVAVDGIAPLLTALEDGRCAQRRHVASFVGLLCGHPPNGINMNPALPVLLRCLRDHDDRVVGAEALALGALKLDADACIPALVELTHHVNVSVRLDALVSISRFGSDAQSVVPVLTGCLVDSDAQVRIVATNTLRKIAPEILRN